MHVEKNVVSAHLSSGPRQWAHKDFCLMVYTLICCIFGNFSAKKRQSQSGRCKLRLYTCAAQLEEKAAAIQALAMYAESCPLSFQQFLPSTLDLICRMSDYFNEIVREEACKCLGTLLTATKTLVASGELLLPNDFLNKSRHPKHEAKSPWSPLHIVWAVWNKN